MKETAIYVRCSVLEKERWKEFAEVQGVPLAVYVRALLNALVEGKGTNE